MKVNKLRVCHRPKRTHLERKKLDISTLEGRRHSKRLEVSNFNINIMFRMSRSGLLPHSQGLSVTYS